MTAKCKLCNNELPQAEIVIPIVGDNNLKSIALGEAMLAHFQHYHVKYVKKMVGLSNIFNGFIIMNRFVIDDSSVIDELEKTRDMLADRIMEDAPEIIQELDEDLEDEEEEENGEEEEDQITEPLKDPSREGNITQINTQKKEAENKPTEEKIIERIS